MKIKEKDKKGLSCESISSLEDCSLIGFASTECVIQNGRCQAKQLKQRDRNLIAKPANMPKNVYEAIKNYNGEDQHIEQKNRVIPAIATALILRAFNRDVEIRNILAGKEGLAGLDDKIIALLPPVLMVRPNAMPDFIYTTIELYGGREQNIAQKNQVIPDITGSKTYKQAFFLSPC